MTTIDCKQNNYNKAQKILSIKVIVDFILYLKKLFINKKVVIILFDDLKQNKYITKQNYCL